MLNFDFIGCKFHFGHRGLETTKFVPKNGFSLLGARRRRTRIFWDKIRGFGGFLDPCDQNETFHTSNEDKVEHMNETY